MIIKASLSFDAEMLAKTMVDNIESLITVSEALEHLADSEKLELSNIIYLTIADMLNEINKLELVGG